MKSIAAMTLGLTLSLCLGACHRQSALAKAQADYQAKEKALEKQMEQNSKNLDQRTQQLQQEANCGALAPGMPAPKTPEDCAKRNTQRQQLEDNVFSLPSIPPKTPSSPKTSH